VAKGTSKAVRRKAAGRAKGVVHSAASTVTGGRDHDDVTLARKVETELFRPADVPKGSISVNVNDGVVELRGELPDQAQIDELGVTASKISGVKDVRAACFTRARTGADAAAGPPAPQE
jgi:osmotically-inducible protein OsmY